MKKKQIEKKPQKGARKPTLASFDPPIESISSVSQQFIANLFGVSPSAVSQWEDCPRRGDGTYDTKEVVRWYSARRGVDKIELEKEKLQIQIEKMRFELSEAQKYSIPKEESQRIFARRGEETKAYFMDVGMMNLHHFAHKPVESLRPLWKDFVKKCFNNWADSHP